MSIYEIRTAIDALVATDLDDLEEAVGNWERLESEGYDDAYEVIDAIAKAGEWVEVADNLGLEPEEVEWAVKNWENASAHFDSAGFPVECASDMKDVIEKLSEKGGASEVVTALKLLVSALVDSGILAGTVSDLAPVKDGEPEPFFDLTEVKEMEERSTTPEIGLSEQDEDCGSGGVLA